MAGKVGQWASRLTGFSTPLFGASWQTPVADRDVAAELLARLEDRRVLFNPSEAEVPHHCVLSVIEMRRDLTASLAKAGNGVLANHIRAMGTASRRFLDRLNAHGGNYDGMRPPGHWLSWEFLDALGQMRGIFGVHIAMIAARFDLQVTGDLVAILPSKSRSDDLEPIEGKQ